MSDEDELAWTSSCDDERHEELVLDELNLAPVAGSQFGMPKTHPFNVFDEFSHKLDNENDAQDDAAHSNDDADEDEEALFEALDAAQSQVERMNNELDLDAPLGHSGKENTTPARGVAHARPVRRALAPRSEGNAQSSPMTPSWDGQSDGSRDFTDNYLADASCAEDEGRGTFVSEPLLTPRSPSPSPRFGMERDSELHDDEGKFLIEREREVPVQGFQVLEQIGNGTFGTVYKIASTNEDDNNMYVLKQVNLNGLTQAQQMETINEAHFMIELEDHDNIVKHHSSFIEGGCLNMVMEFCGGGDLHGRIRTHKIQGTRFDEDFIWQVLIQICTALQHLHQHRILHRDIKPENVFLDANDQVKVGDLGLGRLLSSQSRFAHSTVGTPFYFSPELCEEALYDERSDIWALGCVVYQMATLNVPFFANNQIALARKIVGEDIRPMPSHYSKDLHFLVHKMLEKDPQNRPDAQQILNYGPVRIRDMQARIDLRERQLSTLHTQRERELLDSNDLLKKQLEACKTEMGEMRKSYEHLIAQARQAESVANQRVCVLENRVLELAQALQSHNPNIPIQELSHGLAGPLGHLDDVRGNDGREEQGRNPSNHRLGFGPRHKSNLSATRGPSKLRTIRH
ncbi:Protein kinase, putative [Hondaea fermentalgiana]|uniref:non-specific serine/threonine protein kinase n=1 Tax=Hondaea fermentalgiana TaxID=2315210 RepID=A0A2R5GFR8_9STRA|nr:Protein kinase, putative [Hondaea fermentalgiana]|eukprot:GBG29750.1 Protein kinase, putative [Hondaea fermentalgiana]